MSTITKERIELFIKNPLENGLTRGEQMELARIALASLEAEPVAWLLSGGGAKNNVSFDSGNAYADPLREVTPLYTAPPAPLQPDQLRHALRPGHDTGHEAWKVEVNSADGHKRDLPGVPQQRGDEKNFKRIRGESMKNNTQPALKERIEKALEDFTKGRASMHVPPLDTDVDVVLAECSDRLSELKARCAALAAENAGLNKFIVQSCYVFDGEQGELSDAYICAIDGRMPQTQVTDAFWDEVKTEARKEGAYFVANRMLAAWDAGFIDDTAKNAADIARMIITSTEFMANAPEGDFDRSFSDGVLEDIADQLRKGGNQ